MRSRSTLLQSGYKNPLGEILDLHRVDKDALKHNPKEVHNNVSPAELAREPFAKKYLDKLKNDKSIIDCTFKVFGEHIAFWPEAKKFLIDLNPRVVVIYRKNILDTILSIELANRHEFHISAESKLPLSPFSISFEEFARSLAYTNLFKSGYTFVKHHFTIMQEFTYENLLSEDFNKLIEAGIIDHAVSAEPTNQYSDKKHNLILNLDEVVSWYKTYISINTKCF